MKLTLNKKKRETLYGYSFVAIWLIGFIFLTLYPLIQSIKFSLHKVTIETDGIKLEYIGLKNFASILSKDLQFVQEMIAYIEEIILYVPIIIVFSIIIAMLLNQKIRFKGIFRSIFFLPVIITSGPVVNELINQGATSVPLIEQYGVIELINSSLNPRIAEPITTMFSEIITILWFSGVQILIFLAGLQKIDEQVYEAARIDGASPWESFWKVTLPSLKSLILVNIIYTIVTLSTFSLNGIIGLISSNLYNPDTGYGYATAMAWIFFIVIAILLAIATTIITVTSRD